MRRQTEPARRPPFSPGEEQVAWLQLIARDQAPKARDESGVDGDSAVVAGCPALEAAGLVGLAVVGPVAADLGLCRVDAELAPAGRREDGVLAPQGDRLLRAKTGVVEGREEHGEPVAGAGAGGDPGEQGGHLVGVEEGALVDGAGGLRGGVLLLSLGHGVGPEDVLADGVAQSHVEDAAVPLGGAGGGRRAVEDGVERVEDSVDVLGVLPGTHRKRVAPDPRQDRPVLGRGRQARSPLDVYERGQEQIDIEVEETLFDRRVTATMSRALGVLQEMAGAERVPTPSEITDSMSTPPSRTCASASAGTTESRRPRNCARGRSALRSDVANQSTHDQLLRVIASKQ
ncbi:hypothetical protein ABZ618_08740 [Streptomyces roseolus]|uniref:hypothetical protein n=1 Tax=Streptomyces roseolus TaxID=67358 RepID=UPI0033D28C5E